MSNRTDFSRLVAELHRAHSMGMGLAERLETELHNAYVAGTEGHGCQCWACVPPKPCEGEHSYYQARCERCGRYSTGADFLEAARKFRETLAAEGIEKGFV